MLAGAASVWIQKLKTESCLTTEDDRDVVLEAFRAFRVSLLVGQPHTKPEMGHWATIEKHGSGTGPYVLCAHLSKVRLAEGPNHFQVPWASPSYERNRPGRNRQCSRC